MVKYIILGMVALVVIQNILMIGLRVTNKLDYKARKSKEKKVLIPEKHDSTGEKGVYTRIPYGAFYYDTPNGKYAFETMVEKERMDVTEAIDSFYNS